VVTVMDPAREQFCFQDQFGGAFIVLPAGRSGIAPESSWRWKA
jgi:hypothetical protein